MKKSKKFFHGVWEQTQKLKENKKSQNINILARYEKRR
jgi:hypothetical protein